MGVGAALVFEAAITLEEEAEEVWVVAAAPVRARTTTKARTMFFMTDTPKVVFQSVDFARQIRWIELKMDMHLSPIESNTYWNI
jgi:thioesterase domain-containing protein